MVVTAQSAMRVKVRWVAALLVGIWVVMTVLYLAPLFWTIGQDERVVRTICYWFVVWRSQRVRETNLSVVKLPLKYRVSGITVMSRVDKV